MTDNQRKIKVAVVFGGRGPEHPVSVLGGGNILAAIDRTKYEVVPVGITSDGHWVQVTDEPGRLALSAGTLPSVEAAAVPGGELIPWAGADMVASAPARIPQVFGDVDVVWPVLHGPFGEDGTIQGLLELAGVPYVGAGVLASAVSMDKEYMNLVFAARGLPIGPYVVVREQDWPADGADTATLGSGVKRRVTDEIEALGWPLFVKPARGGSSIGTSKAHSTAGLHEAIAMARRYDPKILVEAAIDGIEVEVAVLEGLHGAAPDTSMPGQLVLDGGEEFYDFAAKYLDAATSIRVPAPIPDGAIAEIRRLAAAAFEAVDCEGLARVDFFYTSDCQILVNEINTMPGLSPTSGFQKMWEATGVSFADIVDRLLHLALNRRSGPRATAG